MLGLARGDLLRLRRRILLGGLLRGLGLRELLVLVLELSRQRIQLGYRGIKVGFKQRNIFRIIPQGGKLRVRQERFQKSRLVVFIERDQKIADRRLRAHDLALRDADLRSGLVDLAVDLLERQVDGLDLQVKF